MIALAVAGSRRYRGPRRRLGGVSRRAADGFLSLVTDVILVLPIFPLIIVIAAYEKNAGFLTLVVVLGVLGWSYGARQLRRRRCRCGDATSSRPHASVASGGRT